MDVDSYYPGWFSDIEILTQTLKPALNLTHTPPKSTENLGVFLVELTSVVVTSGISFSFVGPQLLICWITLHWEKFQSAAIGKNL